MTLVLFLQVVKLLMLPYIRDVAVAVATVVAEMNQIPSIVSGTGFEIAVLSVTVPVVDLLVHPPLTVNADAKVCPLLPHKRWVNFVNTARIMLIHEREARVI